MRRREFLLVLGSAGTMWPVAARAQRTRNLRHIGMLLPNTPAIVTRSPRIQAFLQGLREFGWVDGETLIIEWRFAEGQLSRLAALAADLVTSRVDVIVTAAAPAARAAKEATSTIPVVIIDPGDPVGTGLVRSLARPSGNVTGVTSIAPDLAAKRLALLKETAPEITSVAVLFNAAIPPGGNRDGRTEGRGSVAGSTHSTVCCAGAGRSGGDVCGNRCSGTPRPARLSRPDDILQ